MSVSEAKISGAPPAPISDQILGAIPYPVLVLDASNSISYANIASEGFFHSSVPFLKGKKLEHFLPFSCPAMDMIERVRARSAAIHEYKVDLSTPRIGADAIVDILASPLPELEDHVLLIFQRRAMADKIDRQLTHRSAARTVMGMASMLAHEIKNPLSGIRGAAQLLSSVVGPDDMSLTQLITDETDRIVNLVDQMEVFSDQRPPERTPVNIHSILNHVKRVAQAGFGKNVRFIEQYDPSLPPVYGNRDQLIQVFLNLVKNSCEATESCADPQIRFVTAYRSGIKMSTPGSDKRISLPLELTISDNGSGIPDSLMAHVFDPFVTTKNNGTGLGLALVSKIIDDHGGIIEIEPNNNGIGHSQGTLVRILMPLWDGTSQIDNSLGGSQDV